MTTPEIPRDTPISVLDAFKRDSVTSTAEKLTYPNLSQADERAKSLEAKAWQEFSAAEAGSLEELSKARSLASGFLIRTAYRLQRTQDPALLSRQLSGASVELYGAPDESLVRPIINSNLAEFLGYRNNANVDQNRLSRVINYYSPYATPEVPTEKLDKSPETQKSYKKMIDALEEKFGPILEVFNEIDPDGADITAPEAGRMFQLALNKLRLDDPAWQDWTFVLLDGAEALESKADLKRVSMGKNRADFSPKQVKAKFCHEFLVHSLRSIHGQKLGDHMMQFGLPEFLDAEEGLALFLEYGLSGQPAINSSDKYADFSLALGQLGNQPVTRSELQKIYVDRNIVRKQAKSQDYDEAKIADQAWRFVNRIYRGSLGNEHVAVNTIDLAYYQGYLKITSYINQQLKNGKSPNEVLEYLLRGKFDPTNQLHQDYIAKLGLTS